MATSSNFRGSSFDWRFGNPRIEMRANAKVMSGEIVIYDQSSLVTMAKSVRQTQSRPVGDPFNSGTTDHDYFGPDVWDVLTMTELAPFEVTINGRAATEWRAVTVTYRALLTSFSREEAFPRGVHFCQAEFIVEPPV